MNNNKTNPQIYVGGLPHDIREHEVRDEFGKYGAITSVHIKNKFAFIVSKINLY